MSTEELERLFETFKESVFRLETLQNYDVDEYSERVRAFQEGRPLPESPQKTAWLREIQDLGMAGKRVHRVHVVDLPLAPYLEYELAVYPENIDAGEDVRIADRASHPDLAELTEDFILFDGDTDQPAVFWVRYTPDGQFISHDRTADPDDIRRCVEQRDVALAHSRSLEEFLATLRAG